MTAERLSLPPAQGPNLSLVLKRTLSGMATAAIAVLDDGHNAMTLGTLTPATAEPAPRALLPRPEAGRPVSFAAMALDPAEIAELEAYAAQDHRGGVWRAFRCRYDSGRVDRIVARIQPEADEGRVLGFLSLIWPILQEDCLQEAKGKRSGFADEAMLWMITQKFNLAVFVVNQEGMMLRSNRAAKVVLDAGHILRRTRQGMACSTDSETRHLREAIAACATSDPRHSESVLFLSPDEGGLGPRVPLTMCRFVFDGEPTPLVMLTLPSPPDSRRIEVLAYELGLTLAEARVAALMQLGLSNRAAAKIAGLTEQTMNTYTKRVLGKLHVTSRAEMAQLLTWRAQGGLMA